MFIPKVILFYCGRLYSLTFSFIERHGSDKNLEHLAEISNGISYFASDGEKKQYIPLFNSATFNIYYLRTSLEIDALTLETASMCLINSWTPLRRI